MKKLDRFIIQSFVGPFFAILLVVVFILMMQFLWLYIDELVGKGLSLKVILEFLGWGCCTMLPLSLPLATLLSTMMAMGTLGENNELLAIKAAGISLQRVFVPIAALCLLISVGTFFACNNLLPVAFNKIYTLRDDIGRTKEEIKIPTGTFYDGIDNYVLRIDDRNPDTGMMYNVIVYNHTSGKGNISLTLADSALMTMSKNKDYLSFTLFNGHNYEEDNTRRYRDTTLRLQTVDFDRQELLIKLSNYAFEKSDSARYSDEVKSMKLSELRHGQDSIGRLDSAAKAGNIAGFTKRNTYIRYKEQLDTAHIAGRRTAFAPEGLNTWNRLDLEINAYRAAKEKAENMQNELQSYARDRMQYVYTLRRINLEILKKYATALACFIFFFIGAPIGALIRKGGLGTPAIISALFFVLYWVIDITGTKLARDGAVSAVSGAFISSYILAPIGAFLTYQAINDSSVFSMDGIKNAFRKVKYTIAEFFKKKRIVYMGTPEFAVASLDALIKKGYKIVGVVTVADKASGRGLKVNESAVKKYAVEHNLPVLQPVSLKDPEFLSALKAMKPDLFVVVAFRMLPKVVWEIPKYGTFNLHAALLPQYRGAAPINWAVIKGEHATGVTTFMIDDGMDTGKIMFREQLIIGPDDNAGQVHDKLMDIGAELVVQTVEAIFENNVDMRVQQSFIQGSEILHTAPKITRELCHIDWNASTKEIYNLIRGLSPYPAAFTEFVKDDRKQQVKIYSAEKIKGHEFYALAASNGYAETPAPGTILSDGKSYLAISTLDGAISLTEIQLAGKKRMHIKDFLIGWRDAGVCTTSKGTSSAIIANV